MFNDTIFNNDKLRIILNRVRKEITELEKIKLEKPRRRYNPDLIVERDNKYYIVEAQIWPVWLKRRYGYNRLTWDAILNEGVKIIPGLMARKVKVKGREVDSSGFYYISYRKGGDHISIERFF